MHLSWFARNDIRARYAPMASEHGAPTRCQCAGVPVRPSNRPAQATTHEICSWMRNGPQKVKTASRNESTASCDEFTCARGLLVWEVKFSTHRLSFELLVVRGLCFASKQTQNRTKKSPSLPTLRNCFRFSDRRVLSQFRDCSRCVSLGAVFAFKTNESSNQLHT